jgi:4'-phosphopantetheinyl transferase
MSKIIYWHIEDIKQLPAHDNWLTENEIAIQKKLGFAKRKNEWRLGRWTAKNALQKHLSLTVSEIEILSKENGAPYVIIRDNAKNPALSISHREQKAIAAFSYQFNDIGCDLEFIERRSNAFINDYFTTDEINFIEKNLSQKDLLANLIWSAKESVSKVLQLGLNLDTRDINVYNISFFHKNDWCELQIKLNENTFHGLWKTIANYVLTLAAREPFEPGLLL